MPSARCSIIRAFRSSRIVILVFAALALGVAGCSKSAPQSAAQEQAQRPTQAKRYHLVGKVVSIDQQQATLNVDGQEIPGFMSAMTMPYPVHDTKSLSQLSPGDEITADVVVDGDSSYLENIIVTKKGGGTTQQPSGTSRRPSPGDTIPDFVLVNQDGKRIHLASYKGGVLLVTFIYTRCPFPDFCPLVSKNFAQIYAKLHNDPSVDLKKIRLLSVSFDPAYDTPAVLRKYAATFSQTTSGNPFDRWEFATVPANELPKVAEFFGLYYNASAGQIVHSLSTTVISPDGTVFKWYEDNDWQPADLLQDAAQSLQQASQRSSSQHSASAVPSA
jgi:protein SCO1